MSINILEETPVDYESVEQVTLKAFADMIHSDHKEHHLVKALRTSDSFVKELSLVAWLDDKIVGHILFTKIIIDDGEQDFHSLAMAPISVLPEYQSIGIGSSLIEKGLETARLLGYESVIVLGHQDYYPRFGFVPASKFGITCPFPDIPDDCFMAKELVPNALKDVFGQVLYPTEFTQEY